MIEEDNRTDCPASEHLSILGNEKIAVFYQNDSYGKAGLEDVTRALVKRNVKPALTVAVERNIVVSGRQR